MSKQNESDQTAQMLSERVKNLRKKKNWTLEDLSMASQVSRSMISQIERGLANPTLAVTCRIAQAFNISIVDLVEEPWVSSSIKVIYADDPTYLYREDQHCRIRTLSPLNMEKNVEFYEISLFAGKALESAAHFEGTHELFTVQKGSVTITSGSDQCKLKKGDSAHYRADVPHKIQNMGQSEVIGFLVVTYS